MDAFGFLRIDTHEILNKLHTKIEYNIYENGAWVGWRRYGGLRRSTRNGVRVSVLRDDNRRYTQIQKIMDNTDGAVNGGLGD